MSFDITGILSKFTKAQRITALVLLLIATIAITLGPKLIESLAPDNTVLHRNLRLQRKQIDSLNIELFDQSQAIIDLNRRIVFQQQECTNAMSERENEIVAMIKGMKSSLTTRHIEYHSTSFDDSSGVAMMMKIRPEEDNTKTIEMLNKLESKIKKK
jgi:hypothetical protein